MTESLKPFDRGKARTPEQAMQDIHNYVPKPTDEPPQETPDKSSPCVAVYPGPKWNRWLIRDVMIGGGRYDIGLPVIPLYQGNKASYSEWIGRAMNEGCHVPSLELYAALFYTLYKYNKEADKDRQKHIGALCELLREQFKEPRYVDTLLYYNRSTGGNVGKDVIHHNNRDPTTYNRVTACINASDINERIDGNIPKDTLKLFFGRTTDLAESFEFVLGNVPILNTLESKFALRNEMRTVVMHNDVQHGRSVILAVTKPDTQLSAHLVEVEDV